MNLKRFYSGKRVLVTGHTGFKGTWLATWLLHLGANIIGVSKDIPTSPSMFNILKLSDKIQNVVLDIRNFKDISKVISDDKPDFVFHLAAQAIVSTSYTNPLETISSNTMGTTNILEALRISNHQCKAIIITSDKAYDNVEQVWGYKENDQMGATFYNFPKNNEVKNVPNFGGSFRNAKPNHGGQENLKTITDRELDDFLKNEWDSSPSDNEQLKIQKRRMTLVLNSAA